MAKDYPVFLYKDGKPVAADSRKQEEELLRDGHSSIPQHSKWPTLVYGNPAWPDFASKKYVKATDQADYDARLAQGYFATEVLPAEPVVTPATAATRVDELEAKVAKQSEAIERLLNLLEAKQKRKE